jgi:hypothetical protein
MREFLERLVEQGHERDDKPHVEWNEKPAAREQKTFQNPFDHASSVPAVRGCHEERE